MGDKMTHATPVSVVADKNADRENTCLHCAKRLVWSENYLAYMHYVNGTLYFECAAGKFYIQDTGAAIQSEPTN
jgi:hypothetical protein